ncbi:MAG: glycosyltransferase family 1 protein, partial [Cyanobacteria bacterium J06621_12]
MSIIIDNNYQNERILIWSQRNIQNYIFNSCLYEFEDLIDSVDNANLVSPPQYNLWEKGIRKAIKNYTKYFEELAYTNPYFDRRLYLDKKYDLFFSIIDFPYNLSSINLIKNWRNNCQIAVCYIIEIWHKDLPKLKNFIKFFQNFDLICLGHSQIVKDVEKIVGRPCIYLPPGVDAAKFYPQNQERAIDLCSLGRRSSSTHQALLELAEQDDFFYYYDHIVGGDLKIREYQAHRTLIANLLKNSRYFITN